MALIESTSSLMAIQEKMDQSTTMLCHKNTAISEKSNTDDDTVPLPQCSYTLGPSLPSNKSRDGDEVKPRRLSIVETLSEIQDTQPIAGPLTQKRYYYIAIRTGQKTGVFTSWSEAEPCISEHPSPVYRTFSTRLAAEAFISGWEGKSKHSLPASTPKPLREHIAMTFPSSQALATSSASNRPSYHARLLSTYPPLPSESSLTATSPIPDNTDFSPGPNTTIGSSRRSSRHSSYRNSIVKTSSPLRSVIIEEDENISEESAAVPTRAKKTISMNFIGRGGLLSPPVSPKVSTVDLPGVSKSTSRQKPNSRPSSSGSGSSSGSQGSARPGVARRPTTKSSLWTSSIPTTSSSTSSSSTLVEEPQSLGIQSQPLSSPASTAPKFSRSGLKKSGIVMPTAAPRAPPPSFFSHTLKHKSSSTSLDSAISTTSTSSTHSLQSTISRPIEKYGRQDRLSSLAAHTQQEMQLNEAGLKALEALTPPRPAFMRQSSSGSASGTGPNLTSNGSSISLSSVGSTGSLPTPPSSIAEEDEDRVSIEDFDNTTAKVEEPLGNVALEGSMAKLEGNMGRFDRTGERRKSGIVVISCTKSDGDAEGSVESTSLKSRKKGNGGLFRRFSKALKR